MKQIGHRTWTVEEAIGLIKKQAEVSMHLKIVTVRDGLGNGAWGAMDFLMTKGWIWLPG